MGKSALLMPEKIQVLLRETEKLLEEWKHPDPYRPPTAPGGMLSMILAAWWADHLHFVQETNGNETCRLGFCLVRSPFYFPNLQYILRGAVIIELVY